MNLNVQQWLSFLAGWAGLDEWLVTAGVLMLGAAFLKLAGRRSLRRCLGCHLKVGEMAQGVLRLLDSPEKWSAVAGGVAFNNVGSPTVLVVKTEDGSLQAETCSQGNKKVLGATNGDFNRWERRLIKKRAEAVRCQLAAWQEQERREAINAALRQLAAPKG